MTTLGMATNGQALSGRTLLVTGAAKRLGRARAVGNRVPHAGPGTRCCGGQEARGTGGRGAIGHTFEDVHALFDVATNLPGGGLDRGTGRRPRRALRERPA